MHLPNLRTTVLRRLAECALLLAGLQREGVAASEAPTAGRSEVSAMREDFRAGPEGPTLLLESLRPARESRGDAAGDGRSGRSSDEGLRRLRLAVREQALAPTLLLARVPGGVAERSPDRAEAKDGRGDASIA
jgi:hypothetical protein